MKIINSIQRILYIIRLYLGENRNREITFWAVVTFFFTVLDHRNFVIFVLYLSSVIRTIYLRDKLFHSSGAVRFQMLPAALHEKLIAIISITTVFHFTMTYLAYCVGNLLVYIIYHLILKIEIPVNWDLFSYTSTTIIDGVIHASIQNVFFSLFGHFVLVQAILLTGIIFFKKYSFIKTAIATTTFVLVVLALQLFLFKALWDVKHLSNAIFPSLIMIQNNTLPNTINSVILYGSLITAPFLWMASYFRMKENTH